MAKVKFSPLRDGKRAQKRMIENLGIPSKSLFAELHRGIHLRDFRHDLALNCLHWQATRPRDCGRLNASWKVSQLDYEQSPNALLQSAFLSRWTGFQGPSKSLGRSGVRQKEMLKDLRYRPLARRMTPEAFRGQACGQGTDFATQGCQMRVHERY